MEQTVDCRQATWRARRIGALSLIALACAVSTRVSSQAALASSPGLASRIAALAKSPAATKAKTSLYEAITGSSVAQLSQSLTAQDGGQLTPFQDDLLKVDLMLANPRARALFSAIHQGRHLTRGQIKLLRKLASVTHSNPAIAMLSKAGGELKKNPTALAADIATFTTSPVGPSQPPSGGALLESAAQRLSEDFTSASVRALAAKIKSLLSKPGALKYVQTLPPSLIASFVPSSQIESFVLPLPGAKAASHINARAAAVTFSPETQARLNYDLLLARITAEDISDELGEALATLAKVPVAPLHALNLWDSVASVSELSAAGQQLQDILTPSGLRLDPSFAEVPPNKEVVFTLDALTTERTPSGPLTTPLGPDGSPLGPVSFTLSIADGICVGSGGHGCTAVHAGEHTVTATATNSGKTVQGVLKIVPGPPAALRLSPNPNSLKVTPGVAQPYTVEEVDEWDNEIGPVMIGGAPGQAQLKIEPDGTCDETLGTCTPEKPGPHTITATDPPYVGRAALNVADSSTPPSGAGLDHLQLTPQSTTIAAGTEQLYTIEGFDVDGNLLGTLGSSSTIGQAELSITPDGSCDQESQTCTPENPGPHTVTATSGTAKGTASLDATEPETSPTGPTIEPSTLPEATLGDGYAQPLELVDAGGQEAETWTVTSGALPSGIELRVNHRPEKQPEPELYGVPSHPGSSTFTITAYNDTNEPLASRTYGLSVKTPGVLDINATNLYGEGVYGCAGCKTFIYNDSGEPFELELEATPGAPPYTWTIAGSTGPYDGLTIAARSGYQLPYVLEGNPPEGTIVVPIEVHDNYGDVGTIELTIETNG